MGVQVLSLFVRRFRRLYIGVAVYLLLLAAYTQIVRAIPEVALGLILPPLFLGLFATLAAFANPDTDLASETSGYPPFLLRMPIPSRTLAAWPIMGVAVWSAVTWLILAGLCLRPAGISVPLLWPAVMMACLGAMFQAVLWSPMRSGMLRLILAILCPIATVATGMWLNSEGVAELKLAAGFCVAGMISAAIAARAVSKARITGSFHSVVKDRVFKDQARKRKPFGSPFMAQFWVEWKKQGRFLPLITAFVMVLLSIPIFFETLRFETNFWGYLMVSPWVFSWIRPMLAIPILIGTILGMGASRSYLRSPEGAYHLYFATRPISTAMMVRAKYLSITAGVLLAWLIVIATMFLWLQVPANDRFVTAPLWTFMLTRWEASDWGIAAFVMGLCMLATWRNQTIGVFVDFAAFPAIRGLYAIAVSVSAGVMFVLLTTNRTFFENSNNAGTATVIVLSAVAAKLAVAVWLSIRLIRANPRNRALAYLAFGQWTLFAIAAAFGMRLLVHWIYPPEVSHWLFEGIILPMVGVMLVPLARPLAARLAVEMGRHRR